ncbi:LysE family translocator [Aestuariivirga sp. YIM B02566]|uniref:LysE family translocator n=1 Tax=Taklimakanibacter albus TaxID=2800327 RepID=A0ACC5REP5_9HYPH|nr:LysE family translocator [Aestuariivirga sp. YIM B02566]MBK1871104.1 LysE family translocator [Aestuariivirga sp. YIM B02566]
MTYPEALWIFFILLAGIIIVPGMDMIYVMANALTGGRKAGLTATFGIMAGGAFHTAFGVFAVVGMSQLVPQIYAPMLIAGALYMIWIGVTLARSSIVMGKVDGSSARSLLTIFAQAVVTCILNPKAWLFVLAVYPQFIRPAFGPLWSQALVIGIMVAAVQFAVYGGLGLMAAAGRNAMAGSPAFTIWSGRVAGLLLIAAALLTLWRGWQGL